MGLREECLLDNLSSELGIKNQAGDQKRNFMILSGIIIGIVLFVALVGFLIYVTEKGD